MLIIYSITSYLRNRSKPQFVSRHKKLLFPSQFWYFQRKFVGLSKIVGLRKICRKNFLTQYLRLYDRLNLAIMKGKNAQIQHLWSFLIMQIIKNFSNKIMLDNNTILTFDFFSKNVYDKLLIFWLPVLFLIWIFRCCFASLENYKLQSFRKCIIW